MLVVLIVILCGCRQQTPQSVFDSWQPPQTVLASAPVSAPKPERLAMLPGSSGIQFKKPPVGTSALPTPSNEKLETVGYIRVVIADQRLYAYSGPNQETPLDSFPCSTAAGGLILPLDVKYDPPHNHVGQFVVDFKDIDHNNNKMPFSLHYFEGHYIHETAAKFEHLLGTPASNGCVRLNHTNAKWLFGHTPIGAQLVIDP